MKTVHDRIVVSSLTPSAYHAELTGTPQCLHCHTQLRQAPPVPHPDYESCATCHRVD